MTQSQANVELKNFSKGLVTTVNPLSSDITTTKHMDNWKLHPDGSVSSRLAIKEEYSLYVNTPVNSMYIWNSPEGWDSPIICLFSDGSALFYSTKVDGSIDLYIGRDDNAVFYTPELSVTEAAGKLVIANNNVDLVTGGDHILVVSHEYNTSHTFTGSQEKLLINDLFGIDDGLGIAEQAPGSGPAFWAANTPEERLVISKSSYNVINNGFDRPTLTWYTRYSQWAPSKRSVMSLGLDAANSFSGERAYNAEKLLGDGTAPSGRVKMSITKRGADRVAYMEALPSSDHVYTDNEYNNISTGSTLPYVSFIPTALSEDASVGGKFIVQSHQGRVFYAATGFTLFDGDSQSPDLNTLIFYSQSVTSPDKITKLHAVNDITSAEGNAILSTDGGFINLQGVGVVSGMYSVGDSLLITSNRGVWEITSDGVFTSSTYSVRKITSDYVLDQASIVNIGDKLLYWSLSGIKQVTPDAQSGRLGVTDITTGRIDELYKDLLGYKVISSDNIKTDNTVRWLYKDESYYRELVLDLTLGAYYTSTLSELPVDSYAIVGYNPTLYERGDVSSQLLVTTPSNMLMVNSFTGEPVQASLVSNVGTFGDGTKRKFANYITTYMEQTEKSQDENGLEDTSSCKLRVAWDFADNESSNKYSREFEVYRLQRRNFSSTPEYIHGHNVVVTRNKVRGSGRALAINVNSVSGKYCHLYGVSLEIYGNGKT